MLTISPGELFLGQSSGGIDNLKTPLLLEDIDRFFILGGIQAAYPWLVQILRFLPGASLRELFLAGDRIIKVCCARFLLVCIADSLLLIVRAGRL